VIIVLNDGGTIDDLINRLDQAYGSAYRQRMGEDLRGSIIRRFNFAINGKVHLPSQNIEEPLSDGDHVLFFQSNGGG
jgi:molybdopterin converting factor small subunit